MGVSSGLGTFRGIAAGVWPPLLKHPELDFTDMSNPAWFRKAQGNSDKHDTANFGYAFWAYRYNAYTSSAPHHGYEIAKQWSQLKNVKYSFSFTSNIDGHWIKSGWDESSVIECHGSVHYMQCIDTCQKKIWDTNDALKLNVDPKTDCAIDHLPQCPYCKKLARPNVLMFGDWGFLDNRLEQQTSHHEKFKSNIAKAKAKLLIIELGAGTAVPTVRRESERTFIDSKWTADFIRINPSAEHSIIDAHYKNQSKGQTIEITLDALTALTLIDKAIKQKLKK
jgi:NAD-dependent SIR2 family protein deacetylase